MAVRLSKNQVQAWSTCCLCNHCRAGSRRRPTHGYAERGRDLCREQEERSAHCQVEPPVERVEAVDAPEAWPPRIRGSVVLKTVP